MELYNFIKGKFAEFLEKQRGVTFEAVREIELQVKQVEFQKGKIDQNERGFFVDQDGENEVAFLFKPYFYRAFFSKELPKYHLVKCKTIEEFTGFSFSTKMPVWITDRQTGKSSQHSLVLCKNCRAVIYKSRRTGDKEWYEALLDYAELDTNPIYRSDDYLVNWNQISDAYRTSKNYKCECCALDLSNPSERFWLHTHHKDGNKKNNSRANFQALCYLCHALEHPQNYQRGKGFLDLTKFIELSRTRLKHDNLKKYEQLLKYDYINQA